MAFVPASSFRSHLGHLGGRGQKLQVQGLVITEHDKQRVLITTRVKLLPPLG